VELDHAQMRHLEQDVAVMIARWRAWRYERAMKAGARRVCARYLMLGS
jgi:hypothetical protein